MVRRVAIDARGFVAAVHKKPKTTALLFDQLFYFRNPDNPEEVEAERVLGNNGICKMFFNSTKFRESDLFEDSMRYSIYLGIKITPIFSSVETFRESLLTFEHNPVNPDLQPIIKEFINDGDYGRDIKTTKAFVFCIDGIPKIDENLLMWEQVIEFRKDKTSFEKMKRFHRWVITDLTGKSHTEVEAILGKHIDDYKFILKKHGISTIAGGFTSLLAATPSIYELAQKRTLDAVITIGASISAALLSKAITSGIAWKEASAHPIAYIHDIVKLASKQK